MTVRCSAWRASSIPNQCVNRRNRVLEVSAVFGGDVASFSSQNVDGVASRPVRGLRVHFPDTTSSPRGVPPLQIPCAGTPVSRIALHCSIRDCAFSTKKPTYSIKTASSTRFGGGSNNECWTTDFNYLPAAFFQIPEFCLSDRFRASVFGRKVDQTPTGKTIL